MNRKLQNLAGLACAILSVGVGAASLCAQTGELLYNGIRLPAAWPPDRDPKDHKEMARIPYLEGTNIPAVIPIDVGRQLFVDDFLIASTDLKRTWHQADKYEGNPVLTSHRDGDWRHSTAGSQHGGAFYDPLEKCFKIFYTEGEGGFRGYKKVAISQNGIDWSFPDLGLYRGLYSTETGKLIEPREKSDNTYLLRPSGPNRSGTEDAMWLDAETADPSRRYKCMVLYSETFTKDSPLGHGHYIWTLSDDYRPSSEQVKNTRYFGDYGSIAYNPFRKKWIQSVRQQTSARGRARRYYEHDAYMQSFRTDTAVFWADSDELDEAQLKIPEFDFQPELYSLNVVAYESIMLGVYQIQRCSNKQAESRKPPMPKITDLHMGFSRDGFHFSRPEVRKAFIASTQKDETWDRGYLHIPVGVCTVVGDKLYFFYTGYSGVWGPRKDGSYEKRGLYVGYAMGLATLRRDGFASMDAAQDKGTLTSRPLSFKGKHLFVNVDCPEGDLRAELLDEKDQPIEPFTLENSQPVKTDSTLYHMTWKGADDLSALSGKPVKMRFTLSNGSLYAFWVSPDKSGASYGFVAAGGPGFTGNMDTVGNASLVQPRVIKRP